jgi:hypothetical protein
MNKDHGGKTKLRDTLIAEEDGYLGHFLILE